MRPLERTPNLAPMTPTLSPTRAFTPVFDGLCGERERAVRAARSQDHFTSVRPVIRSRFPYMIALRFFFDMSMPSRIFSVSRM